MVKLVALYRKPADMDVFDRHYFDVHIPLIKKTPGLRKIEITKITGAPIGETKFHVMAEMYYDSVDAMNAGNASPEGRAAAKDLMTFAGDAVTLFFGEVTE
ncbi:MAG: EthD family reductase [Ignavibacteriae bacterium]|nr:EthD family reductase [Ignavibacteria bacterium]MBI3365567.1 EthD family reductase [Ignavibacteriota bacterium]